MSGATFNQGAMSMAIGASPAHSSAESFDVEDESNPQSSAWQAHGQTSPTASQSQRSTAPLQKRRRVTRACDECRRKKIKCDGKQPCTHCTVYSYDCTYDQPSNRRRNPAPQYIEALETRLQRAEALLRTLLPNVDINDPNIEAVVQQKRHEGNTEKLVQRVGESKAPEKPNSTQKEAQLRSMIESTGQLDLDESGHWDFHGGSSGTVFVKRMREQFGGLLGGGYGTPFLPKLPRTMPLGLGPMYDSSPRSATESPHEAGLPNTLDLPSREAARALCAMSLECACALLRFVHQPTFYQMFDRIYDLPPERYGDEENRFLPLLYVMLALGCMFQTSPNDLDEDVPIPSYKAGIDQGLKYFRAARQMMEITDCRDLISLQAILFMVLFLQSSANLSTCYSYIGIALRSALRMGLHRNISGNFNPIERETRRRVFFIIRKMDTYVSALLGFPRMLSDDDIDQELPLEVDDEYITKDGVLPMPPGKTSLYAASNAHTRLMQILAKVIKYIYPTKGLEQSVQASATSSYVISNVKIREIEQDLADWLDKLPMALRPSGEGTAEVLRVQQLLRLAYAHVQMMLYRPFLHYVQQKSCSGKAIDERSYACAAAGVSVSRNIVHITTEMKKRGLLVGAYWFTMYTTFFAILSLVYFVLNNPDKPGSPEILAEANDGKEALKGLARRSQAADRCSMALGPLFEQLPKRVQKGSTTSLSGKKKRSAPDSILTSSRSMKSGSGSQTDLAPAVGISRAATFPVQTAAPVAGAPRTSLDEKPFQLNTLSHPNLRQSYQELLSPTADMSASGTPDSSSTTNSMHGSQYSMPQYNGLPDLSAMMFPSADPFAYPNQPMIELENVKQENFGGMNNNQAHAMYIPNSNNNNGLGMYDDLEGQLFGPIPPYLMQGQQPYDMPGQLDPRSNLMQGQNQNMSYHSGLTPGNEMNFDGIFSGDGEEWSNMADQTFR